MLWSVMEGLLPSFYKTSRRNRRRRRIRAGGGGVVGWVGLKFAPVDVSI